MKKGFTLSEVLITLAIIGVVAAITISNLYSKYQFYVLKKQYQKAYSVLNQAVKLAVNNMGATPQCYYLSHSISITQLYGSNFSGCGNFKEETLEVLQIAQSGTKSEMPNIIPTYKNTVNPFDKNEYQMYYVLNDGTIIMSPYGNFPSYFAVDVNGNHGPNKWGYDVFALMLVSTDRVNINLVPYRAAPVEDGGKNHADFLYK